MNCFRLKMKARGLLMRLFLDTHLTRIQRFETYIKYSLDICREGEPAIMIKLKVHNQF